jgi:hypothetical protein
LCTLVREIATTDTKKCFESFLEMLRMNEAAPISIFVMNIMSACRQKGNGELNKRESMNHQRVADYLDRLAAALGDDSKFETLFDELSADETLTRNEAVAIASQFCGQTAKSTPRRQALQRIHGRQMKLMRFKRHSSTTANHSAA